MHKRIKKKIVFCTQTLKDEPNVPCCPVSTQVRASKHMSDYKVKVQKMFRKNKSKYHGLSESCNVQEVLSYKSHTVGEDSFHVAPLSGELCPVYLGWGGSKRPCCYFSLPRQLACLNRGEGRIFSTEPCWPSIKKINK